LTLDMNKNIVTLEENESRSDGSDNRERRGEDRRADDGQLAQGVA
jgi:hypothetical protein